MSLTMDTDYGLSIPTHRPSITMDPRNDAPLPLRRELDQTTELTAENSTPYTLAKPRSGLEALPFDVRLIIWQQVGFVFKQMSLFKSTGGGDCHDPPSTYDILYAHDHPWHPTVGETFFWGGDRILSGVLAVNRSICEELVDLLLRNAGTEFRHRLSNRNIFLNPYKNGSQRRQRRDQMIYKPCMERMLQASCTFELLRHVYLGPCSDSFDEPPHSMQVCRTQVRRFVAKQAETIRFIGDHCPLLATLQVAISSWPRVCAYSIRTKERPMRFCKFEAITVALQYVAQKRLRLETLRAVTQATPRKQSTPDTAHRVWSGCFEEIRGLRLIKIPVYLREEWIRTWVETRMHKVIDGLCNERLLTDTQYDLWQDLIQHGSEGDWQLFRTTVIGQEEFEDVEVAL